MLAWVGLAVLRFGMRVPERLRTNRNGHACGTCLCLPVWAYRYGQAGKERNRGLGVSVRVENDLRTVCLRTGCQRTAVEPVLQRARAGGGGGGGRLRSRDVA